MRGLALAVVVSTLLYHVVADFNLTIMHTNDVHARIVEAHKYGGVCTEKHQQSGSCVGGVSRRATEIKRIRAQSGNASLLLDGGDQFQGTFWFYVYQGEATAYFMQKLGYDAMVSLVLASPNYLTERTCIYSQQPTLVTLWDST